MTAYIYALCCPDTGDVRYVGMTVNPERRLIDHLAYKGNSLKARWVQDLLLVGKQPEMKILQTCAQEEAAERERVWIDQFRSNGALLTNTLGISENVEAMLERRWQTPSKDMASFRSHLRQLMLNKSAKIGKPLSQKTVADTAGVSLATVQRWFDPAYTFNRVDADTVKGLTKFFECKFEDLIEIVE